MDQIRPFFFKDDQMVPKWGQNGLNQTEWNEVDQIGPNLD